MPSAVERLNPDWPDIIQIIPLSDISFTRFWL
jgi:hypothetical protein